MGEPTPALLPESLARAKGDNLSQSSNLFLLFQVFFSQLFRLRGLVLGSGVALG